MTPPVWPIRCIQIGGPNGPIVQGAHIGRAQGDPCLCERNLAFCDCRDRGLIKVGRELHSGRLIPSIRRAS